MRQIKMSPTVLLSTCLKRGFESLGKKNSVGDFIVSEWRTYSVHERGWTVPLAFYPWEGGVFCPRQLGTHHLGQSLIYQEAHLCVR